MALSASSSCTKTVMAVSESAKVLKSTPTNQVGGVVPLPVKPKFQSSALQRTKSRKPVTGAKVSAAAVSQSADSKVGGEIETVSGENVDAVVDTGSEEAAGPAGAMRVRKTSAGKSNSRTSRRRALVMCLALGMVRPCASTVESNGSSSTTDLRRTASAMPALRRTTSKVPSTLISQVSLATTMKQTNLLGEPEDLQKLTSLQ